MLLGCLEERWDSFAPRHKSRIFHAMQLVGRPILVVLCVHRLRERLPILQDGTALVMKVTCRVASVYMRMMGSRNWSQNCLWSADWEDSFAMMLASAYSWGGVLHHGFAWREADLASKSFEVPRRLT